MSAPDTFEWEPTFTLDKQVSEVRANYDAVHGKGAFARRADSEWAEAERIEAERLTEQQAHRLAEALT